MLLDSERISLRPFKIEDIEIVHQWRRDIELRFLMMMHPYPITLDQDRAWINQILNDTSNKTISFAAETKKENRLVGYLQFREISKQNRHAFLAIVIGETTMRGKGFGKEILRTGINYGFNHLGLNKISLEALVQNINAIKLYENCGFEKEGNFKSHYYFNGKYYDVLRMAIFKNLKKNFE